MRIIPPIMKEALAGSAPDAKMVFHAFYDGRLKTLDSLPVDKWIMRWNVRSRTVIRSEGTLTVADETGGLSPWGLEDPLSAAGSQLSAVFHCGGESLDLARFTVTRNRPSESLMYAAGRWNFSGSEIGVTAAELSQLIQDDEFIAAEAPTVGITVVNELKRILQGHVNVLVDPSVVDRVLPPMVHPENRLEAAYALIDMVGDARFTGDGQLYLYVPQTKPLFTIQGKPMGDLVSVGREQSRDKFYNVVVSTGKDPDGNELKAYSRVLTGGLRDGGPFKRRVYRHNSLATTQSGVQADANSMLETLLRDSTVEIPFECVPSALIGAEAGDYGQIRVPVADGNEYPLRGRLLEAQISGGAGGFDPGRGVLAASPRDVERLSQLLGQVRRNP